MEYSRHYETLCERAKNRNLEEYTEKHHIIPRCMGGTDGGENLVDLTPEEHYVAHQLLVKMHPDNGSLIYAANMMSVDSSCTSRNNKRYGWLKKKYQQVAKARIGPKNGSYGRSWYYHPDTKQNGKFLKDQQPNGWIKGRILPESKKRRWFYNPKSLEVVYVLEKDKPDGWERGKNPKKLKKKPQPEPKLIKKCKNCGKDFEPKKKQVKYCIECGYKTHSRKNRKRFKEKEIEFLNLIKSGDSFSNILKKLGYKSYNLQNGVGKWAKELLERKI